MTDGSPNSRRARRGGMLPVMAMLAVLAGGAVLSAVNPATFAAVGRLSLLDGEWAARYQGRYEEALPLRPLGAAVWDLLRYRMFAEGARGVLVGKEGWLFTAEEFETGRADGEPLAAQLDRVGELARTLAERGVALVVVLVPAKARIYPEVLGRHTMPAALEGRYEAVRRGLAARGIEAPDLLRPLAEARRRQEVFLRTDTHWTPYGARVAAEAVASVVTPELERAGSPRAAFTAAPEGVREHRGDLLNFIRLGPRLEGFGPPPDTVTPVSAVPGEQAELGLFDEIRIPVVLAGTSYSAGTLWSFEDALKAALQVDVLNVAEEGRGPFVPMQTLLEGTVLADVRADVVVWEIPERYFQAPCFRASIAASRSSIPRILPSRSTTQTLPRTRRVLHATAPGYSSRHPHR